LRRRNESTRLRLAAAERYQPSMKLSADRLYKTALAHMPETIDGEAPQWVSNECLWALSELLSPSDDDALVFSED
jgi:hypothetical protein